MFTKFIIWTFYRFFIFLKLIQAFCSLAAAWFKIGCNARPIFFVVNFGAGTSKFFRANKLVFVSVILEMAWWLMVTLGQTQPLTQLSFSLSWSSQSCLDFLAQAKLRFWFLCRILLNYLTRINISDACQLLISGLYGPMSHHFSTSMPLNGFTVFQLLNINNFGSHCIQVHHFQIYQLQLSVPIVSSVFNFHHHA